MKKLKRQVEHGSMMTPDYMLRIMVNWFYACKMKNPEREKMRKEGNNKWKKKWITILKSLINAKKAWGKKESKKRWALALNLRVGSIKHLKGCNRTVHRRPKKLLETYTYIPHPNYSYQANFENMNLSSA